MMFAFGLDSKSRLNTQAISHFFAPLVHEKVVTVWMVNGMTVGLTKEDYERLLLTIDYDRHLENELRSAAVRDARKRSYE